MKEVCEIVVGGRIRGKKVSIETALRDLIAIAKKPPRDTYDRRAIFLSVEDCDEAGSQTVKYYEFEISELQEIIDRMAHG